MPSASRFTAGASKPAILREIEAIIGAEGMVSDGVFSIEIDREDIQNVRLRGVRIDPSFEINGTIYFQPYGNGAFMNADMALKANEIDPFIDELLRGGIIFQAEHQHFYDFDPPVWFIHYRAAGDPIRIALAIKAALNVTSTPFPQTSPPQTTPLPENELSTILGGSASIGGNGVVTVDVPRLDPITLGGVRISPFLNVANSIAFQPLSSDGRSAAVAPDFSMVAHEVQNVMRVMRRQGWDIGCLYNQEIDENPQLFFSHQFKIGNPVELAREVRRGLDQTNSARGGG